MQNFNILASLCSLGGWFDHYLLGNTEDGFSHIQVLLIGAMSVAAEYWQAMQVMSGRHDFKNSMPLPFTE